MTARVGDGTQVTIHQTTHYPFDEQIKLTVRLSQTGPFPALLARPWLVPGTWLSRQR